MSRNPQRWITAGLASALAVVAGGLALRHHRAEQALRLRAAGESTLRGLEAEVVTPLVLPETPEMIAEEVTRSLVAWRQAILVRDADAVVRLDRSFMSAPDRYRGALVESARNEGDERVRAFSTRVLGKQKNPAFANLFETLLADKSPFVRQNAAWALGELAVQADGRAAARRAVAELRHARAKDPAPDVRTAAKGALARLE